MEKKDGLLIILINLLGHIERLSREFECSEENFKDLYERQVGWRMVESERIYREMLK